jgi:hypothetical protein
MLAAKKATIPNATDIDEVIKEFRKDPEMAKALDDVKKASNHE